MSSRRRRDRARPDACPGAWHRHDAADGALARFRPVGGAVSAAELRVLAGATMTGGSPLELTSRGSLQVRGLDPRTADDLADALRSPAPDALLDDRGRDVPCSLVASPRGDVGGIAGAVAAGLRERTAVPGRLLVAVDDGTGDVTGRGADVAVARTAEGWALVLDGVDTGLRTSGPIEDGGSLSLGDSDGPSLALGAVDAFLALRGEQWRLAEVPDGVARVAAAVCDAVPGLVTTSPTLTPGPADPSRLGIDGETLEVLPRLAELDLATVGVLTALLDAGTRLRVTPWRTLVLRDLADPTDARDRLAGLVETDPASRWAGISACVGAPRCAKALTDVRGDLTAAVGADLVGGGQVRQHWIGCHRACGTPGGRVAVVEAQPDGLYATVVRRGAPRS